MLAKLPSVQRPYTDYFSGDPALRQAPEAPDEKAAAEDVKAYEDALAEYNRQLEDARARGDWSALLVGPSEPTSFLMAPLSTDQATAISTFTGQTPQSLCILAFRQSVQLVSNLGSQPIKPKRIRHEILGAVADVSFFEANGIVPVLAMQVMAELGALVLNRALVLDPKS